MHRVFFTLFSVLYWLFYAVFVIVFFFCLAAVWLITSPFDKKLVVTHILTNFTGFVLTFMNPFWQVKIKGRKKIKKGQVYIIISNHQSLLDIFTLHRLFVHFKWVSKSEVFKIPFMGWYMRLNKYVEIKRGDRKSTVKMMLDCENTLRNGNSIIIFPEGTRSKNGVLRHFKDGAFVLAKNMQVNLLPVVLDGTYKCHKGLLLNGPQKIIVNVLDPVPLEKINQNEINDLKKHTHHQMAEELQRIRDSK